MPSFMEEMQTPIETYKPPTTRAILRVNDLLIARYGQRAPTPRDPLDGLILILLSQATSDVNCDRAFGSLKQRFPTWEEARLAPVGEIADTIRSGGLANQKAARIKQILQQIWEESGSLDLAWMHAAESAECVSYLQKFKGIGPKTVACVLVFFLGKPAFPVDTHVHRLTKRLGWVPAKASAEAAHSALEKLVPDACKLDLHVNLISHGRAVCRAEGNGGPRCGECVILKNCNYGKKLRVKSTLAQNQTISRFHGTDFFVTMEPAKDE